MSKREPLCPFCGAYSTRQCDLEEETGGMCPWEEMDDDPERSDEDDASDEAVQP
jgi:hypothetical protein